MSWWAKDYLFLPPKYLDDLRRANSDNLSFFKNISDVNQVPCPTLIALMWTFGQAFNLHHSVGDLYDSDVMAEVVKRRLNPLLRVSAVATLLGTNVLANLETSYSDTSAER